MDHNITMVTNQDPDPDPWDDTPIGSIPGKLRKNDPVPYMKSSTLVDRGWKIFVKPLNVGYFQGHAVNLP